MPKKNWNKLPTSNAMHFSTPTSHWCATQQQLGWSYNKCNRNKNGYTTCRWKCTMLLSYTWKLSRDVDVHCIGCGNLFQFFWQPTYTSFFKRTLSLLVCILCYIIEVLIFCWQFGYFSVYFVDNWKTRQTSKIKAIRLRLLLLKNK